MHAEHDPSSDDMRHRSEGEQWKTNGYNLPSVFINVWTTKMNAAQLLQTAFPVDDDFRYGKELFDRPALTVHEQMRKDEEEGRHWAQSPDEDLAERYDLLVAQHNREIAEGTMTPERMLQFVERAATFIYGESIAALKAKGL